MAVLVSGANGNLTAAGTWQQADAGGAGDNQITLISTSTASTSLTTGNLDSATFVAGAVTVDGVALKLATRAAGSPTNTLTVILRNSTGAIDVATVVVNVSDLDSCDTTQLQGGWYFFRFSAPVLLLAATNYVIRLTLSATSTAVAFHTNGTANNWQRILRTTTTAAPAVGDDLHLVGEFDGAASPATTVSRSVTMNETAATDYGAASTSVVTPSLSVNKRATLVWGTAAATNYRLRQSGNLVVFSGGTLTMGSSGTPCPRDSSYLLEFDCAADGDFGITVKDGGTFTAYGQSRSAGKTIWKTKLSADHAAAATTITVLDDTGWLNGDDVGIAPTAQTSSQFERRTLNANAGASSFTVSSGLTNAHLGSGDYFAEILLLTRNVRIEAVTTTLTWYFEWRAASIVACEWVSFRYLSGGAHDATIYTQTTGSLTHRYCVFQDLDGQIITSGNHGGWTIDQSAFYNMRVSTYFLHLTSTTATWTITDLNFLGNAGSLAAIRFDDFGGSIGSLTISGCSGSVVGVISINESVVESANGPTLSGTWVAHSNAGWPIDILVSLRDVTFPRTEFWRHLTRGVNVEVGIGLDNVEFNGGFWLANGPSGEEPCGIRFARGNPLNDVRFRDLDIASDSSVTIHWGCLFDKNQIVASNLQWINCRFSQNTGTRRPVTVADIGFAADVAPGTICATGVAINCSFGSSGTPISFYYASGPTPSRCSKYSAIRCPMYGQSATAHRTYTPRATLAIETGTVDVTPGLKISPLEGTTTSFDSNCYQPGWGFLVPVVSGASATVSVKVQIDASYNGATMPQLVVLRNDQVGITADTVLATHPGGSGTFQTLSAATPVATADGAFELVVRVYGTAGNVFVDTWAAV